MQSFVPSSVLFCHNTYIKLAGHSKRQRYKEVTPLDPTGATGVLVNIYDPKQNIF